MLSHSVWIRCLVAAIWLVVLSPLWPLVAAPPMKFLGEQEAPSKPTSPAAADSDRIARIVEDFNYVLGTQTFGVKYGFTDESRLVETARRIYEMGSTTLKLDASKGYTRQYGIEQRDDLRSAVDLITKEPSYQAVFRMPFRRFMLWIYSFDGGRFLDGLTEAERKQEYDEIYALTKFLLTKYNRTGREFYIGHWEGDWHLHREFDGESAPSRTACDGMVAWLNVRQQAIEDARRDVSHENVSVWQYTEVNLVEKGMRGESCLATSVLPFTNVDYVSYSSYDVLGWGGTMKADTNPTGRLVRALDFLEGQLRPKPQLPGRRVFIGEYGFAANRPIVGSPQRQSELSAHVAAAAMEWGCPFSLYWAFYCNEPRDDGSYRGFWMIDNENQPQPVYRWHRDYYHKARNFVRSHAKQHGAAPSDEAFRKFAARWLKDTAHKQGEPR